MSVLMPSPVFRWFVPAQNGTGLVPAAGYKAKFYAAGTDIAKTIYELDGDPYPSPSNEAELNAEGFAGILLGTGSYKLVVTDPDDAEVYTQDNITGDGSFGTGFCATVIATDFPQTNGLAQLSTANRFTWCAGYWDVGDGGHGFFRNDVSSEPDDGGYVIASTYDPSRRWFRVPDEAGDVRAASFGYVGTRSSNLTNELLAAASYCQENNKRLLIGAGDAATFGVSGNSYSLYIPACHFEEGSLITGAAGVVDVRIYGTITGSASLHFVDIPVLFATPQTLEYPQWFGASLDEDDNTTALNKWFRCMGNPPESGSAFVLPGGDWAVADISAIDIPDTCPTILLGKINGGEPGDVLHGVQFPGSDSTFAFDTWKLSNGETLSTGSTDEAEFSGTFVAENFRTPGEVEAVNNISSDASLIAGAYVQASFGTGTGKFRAAGFVMSRYNSPESTSGGGLSPLLSQVMAANSMHRNGDRLKIITGGTISEAINTVSLNKRFVIQLGGQTLFDQTLVKLVGEIYSWGSWALQLDLVRNGDSDFVALGSLVTGLAGGFTTTGLFQQSSSADYRSGVLDWTVSNTLEVLGQCIGASATITNDVLFADYFPMGG